MQSYFDCTGLRSSSHAADAATAAMSLPIDASRISSRGEMAEEIIFSVKESLNGGDEAQALAALIFTEADNVEELRSAVRDATECHFKEGELPKLIRLHFVRDEVIAV